MDQFLPLTIIYNYLNMMLLLDMKEIIPMSTQNILHLNKLLKLLLEDYLLLLLTLEIIILMDLKFPTTSNPIKLLLLSLLNQDLLDKMLPLKLKSTTYQFQILLTKDKLINNLMSLLLDLQTQLKELKLQISLKLSPFLSEFNSNLTYENDYNKYIKYFIIIY